MLHVLMCAIWLCSCVPACADIELNTICIITHFKVMYADSDIGHVGVHHKLHYLNTNSVGVMK